MTQDELKNLLRYEEETGLFFWNVSNSRIRKKGAVAGRLSCWGYILINLGNKVYFAQRLVWLYVHGTLPKEFPAERIDHINQIKTDNRLANLRLVSAAENQMNRGINKNNTSGYRGVSWSAACNKWRASIRKDGKLITLGFFENIEDAAMKYKQAAHELFPSVITSTLKQ